MASVGAEDLGHCLAKRKTPASRPESFNQERFPAGTAGAGGDKRVPAHAHSPEHVGPTPSRRAVPGRAQAITRSRSRRGHSIRGGPGLGGAVPGRSARGSGAGSGLGPGRAGAGSREGPGGGARGPGAPGRGGSAPPRSAPPRPAARSVPRAAAPAVAAAEPTADASEVGAARRGPGFACALGRGPTPGSWGRRRCAERAGARGPGPGRGGEREWPARAWRVSGGQCRPRGAGGRRAGPGAGAGAQTSRGACGWGPEPAGTCGRKGAGRRVEARPAAGLGDLPRRRPLALDPASAGRAGASPPPTLAGPGSRTCASHTVASIVVPRSGPARPVGSTPGEAGLQHCPSVPAPFGRNGRPTVQLGRGDQGRSWDLGRRLGVVKGGSAGSPVVSLALGEIPV